MRDRKCALCGLYSANCKAFPKNPQKQYDWVDRLGRPYEESIELLARFRDAVAKKVDTRWCHRHFSNGSDLPTVRTMVL